jgi:hypothetical protein
MADPQSRCRARIVTIASGIAAKAQTAFGTTTKRRTPASATSTASNSTWPFDVWSELVLWGLGLAVLGWLIFKIAEICG